MAQLTHPQDQGIDVADLPVANLQVFMEAWLGAADGMGVVQR
jgi:hypothetical protein